MSASIGFESTVAAWPATSFRGSARPSSIEERQRMKLAGRIAIVTGAARGIGRACAERFLAEGAKVVIADVDTARLDETAKAIGNADNLLAVVTDVSKKDQVEALITEAVKGFGRVDIMVNNAGIAM